MSYLVINSLRLLNIGEGLWTKTVSGIRPGQLIISRFFERKYGHSWSCVSSGIQLQDVVERVALQEMEVMESGVDITFDFR